MVHDKRTKNEGSAGHYSCSCISMYLRGLEPEPSIFDPHMSFKIIFTHSKQTLTYPALHRISGANVVINTGYFSTRRISPVLPIFKAEQFETF
jgi:hypothetical protein